MEFRHAFCCSGCCTVQLVLPKISFFREELDFPWLNRICHLVYKFIGYFQTFMQKRRPLHLLYDWLHRSSFAASFNFGNCNTDFPHQSPESLAWVSITFYCICWMNCTEAFGASAVFFSSKTWSCSLRCSSPFQVFFLSTQSALDSCHDFVILQIIIMQFAFSNIQVVSTRSCQLT